MVQLHRLRLSIDDSSLIPVLNSIRAELELPESFPPDVLAQAERACEQWEQFLEAVGRTNPLSLDDDSSERQLSYAQLVTFKDVALPAHAGVFPDLDPQALPRLDATHIPFVTIDPEGSRDLDQAVHFHRIRPDDATAPEGGAVLITYAIASLATFVPAGSALDQEVRSRGLTVYLPDESTPLHPPVLSEDAASLLPGQVAPACVWQIVLDEDGRHLSATVRRALARSRSQLTYEQVHESWRRSTPLPNTPADMVELLQEVGNQRRRIETERGGVSSPTPEQEIVRHKDTDGSSRYRLEFRANTPAEEWNAQISLLTGICAAEKMRAAGLAILRTVPAADDFSFRRLRSVARLLHVEWPSKMPYSDLVPTLDPRDSQHASFLLQAMSLYRGAAYQVFARHPKEGQAAFPAPGDAQSQHAAIAAEYGHATAPLRRLVDRWTSEICLSYDQGVPIPTWLGDSIDDIPGLMAEAGQRASAAERAAVAATSAKILSGHEGELFHGVITERRGQERGRDHGPRSERPTGEERQDEEQGERGKVMVVEPAVMATVVALQVDDNLPLGEETDVRLDLADVTQRKVRFTWTEGME
ncbi:RNB domain-containing ribonuclease [Schaalia vaccimaxillae]|uniref:RNB domain-containing ribonuclease n=1 Tax=Schaalia vaccimaxillae TaxID=183916 RepID=UPI0003B51DA9|nr:RNB domain-containing ribonuclease [Schaalia vaccimaxillae]